MNKMFEIGELGIIRDIPSELSNLETVCQSLRGELKKYKNLAGFLGLCLGGVVLYFLLKPQPAGSKKEE